jgi:hypothetical protein
MVLARPAVEGSTLTKIKDNVPVSCKFNWAHPLHVSNKQGMVDS